MSRTKDPLAAREVDIELSWSQALAWRTGRHLLANPAGDPVSVVSRLAGVQAQVMSSVNQVVGVRTATDGLDLGKVLWEERALVKTWAMRGTLHLLPSIEYPTWIAALRSRQTRITPAWERYHGVTGSELEAIRVHSWRALR